MACYKTHGSSSDRRTSNQTILSWSIFFVDTIKVFWVANSWNLWSQQIRFIWKGFKPAYIHHKIIRISLISQLFKPLPAYLFSFDLHEAIKRLDTQNAIQFIIHSFLPESSLLISFQKQSIFNILILTSD